MQLNHIYKFDFNKLYRSKIIDGILKCTTSTCLSSCEVVSKRDSLLIEQIMQVKDEKLKLEEILVVLDFSKFIRDKHNMNELEKIEAISLDIAILDGKRKTDERRTILVEDFLKSNSMSKDCQMYFINSKCKDKYGNNLHDELNKRILSNFAEYKTDLSKLYSYSGSMCSDCTLLKNISFEEGELVVVKDKFNQKPILKDCITMISKEFVYDKLREISKNAENEQDINKLLKYTSCMELDAIYNSLNLFDNNILDHKTINLLNGYNDVPKNDITLFSKGISKLIGENSILGTNQGDITWERIRVKNFPFYINLFDGEGLISKEFCEEIRRELHGEIGSDTYDNSNSFQIRLPYVKGMVHSCDIKEFFRSKGIKYICKEHTIDNKEYDINKVKMILTKSQFKIYKFLQKGQKANVVSSYIKYLHKYKFSFGIVNADKGEQVSGKDEYCSLEYQFLSTLPLSVSTLKKLRDNVMWRSDYLCSKENIIKSLKNSFDDLEDEDKQNIANKTKQEWDMYNLSPSFYCGTKKYKQRKYDIYSKIKKDAVFSKFGVHGCRRYLSADLLELLYFVAFNEYSAFEPEAYMGINDYFLPSTHPLETSAIFLRSPHYSRNEIVFLNKRRANKKAERERFFNHLTGVVMINPRSLAAERLGGADYDGDTVVIVNEKQIIDDVKNNIIDYSNSKINYSYLPCKIPSLNGDESLEYSKKDHRLKCLQNTFSSRIGKLSNRAFIDSAFVYNGNDSQENNHSKIAEYTILSGIEIDSAKSGKKPDLEFLDEKIELIGEKEKHLYKCLKLYLEAKRAYDDSSGFIINDLIDLLHENKNVDIEDNNDSFGSNVLNVVCLMNELKTPHRREINEALNISSESYKINYSLYPKALAIVEAYREATNIIHRVISNKAKEANQDKKDIVYLQLLELLDGKEISIEELIDSVEIDNFTANEILSNYIEDAKFHFITDKEEKKKYIKELIPNLTDQKIIDLLIDFSNDGFRLLFLYLNYLSKNISECRMIGNTKTDNLTKYLSDENSEIFIKELEKHRKHINEIIDIEATTEDNYLVVIKYLKEESKSISFAEVIKSIDIYTSSMVFDVFFDIFKQEIGGVSNGK